MEIDTSVALVRTDGCKKHSTSAHLINPDTQESLCGRIKPGENWEIVEVEWSDPGHWQCFYCVNKYRGILHPLPREKKRRARQEREWDKYHTFTGERHPHDTRGNDA